MGRRRIVGVAVGLAILALVAPLTLMTLIAHQRAVDAEYAHLNGYARATLQRADLTLTGAKAALQVIESQGLRGCTAAHVTRMRQLTIENRIIEEMGYYQRGLLTCTSWGPVAGRVPRGAPDQVLAGGYGLFTGVRPKVSKAHEMVVLTSGDHNVLINPQQLVDVILDTAMVLGVATRQGRVIVLSGQADPDLIARLSQGPLRGLDDQHVFVSAAGRDLTAFAVIGRAAVKGRFYRELLVFVPLALLISATLIAVVVWLLRQRLSPRAALEEALSARAIVAHYQPIIDLATGRCVGAEALCRWRLPDGSWASPDQFIPLAEESGLIDALTDLMIERVVGDLDAMFGGEHEVHVAINLSVSDIETGRFLPVLAQTLARTGVLPSQIWLEATERGFINAAAARDVLDRARAAGYMVAIDDFGTGYSSLSLLESLPLDALKIDRSFIATFGRETATSVVTPHIIEMAHSLKFDIVAEGVETVEQESLVRAAGVQFAQGWLYAKALSPEDFAAFFYARNSPTEPATPLGVRLRPPRSPASTS
ncbi:EAL domain-containing protein [Phenylobacterium immobile]|uniref:EAL domain-containing protein n=1 Tax=Phenylobacterium immobile TaxID=21 RepID=UPI000B1590D3|nr:EAL domain-containing protein [Phenylobacterium immobile]